MSPSLNTEAPLQTLSGVVMASKKPKPQKMLGPLDENYWKVQDIDRSRQGDDSPDKIYHAVGAALTAWEMVEETTATMFLMLAGGGTARSANILSRVFGKIAVHSARWEAIEAVCEVNFGAYWSLPIGRTKFSGVKRAVLAASRRRNEVAHGKVLHYNIGDQYGLTDAGAFLTAPDYDTDRNRWLHADVDDIIGHDKSEYRYTSADIISLVYKFEELRKALYSYGIDNKIDTKTWANKSIIRYLSEQK